MKQQAPVDPPPRIGDEGLGSAFAPGFLLGTGEAAEGSIAEGASPEPEKSFFRGVVVGLAIMIPVWAWLLIRFLL
jgi:hypothetical protein